MTGGASKIPPHIARELRRHVKPKIPNNSSTSTNKSHFKFGGFGKGDSSSSNSKLYTLLGCSAFIGITASFPFFGMAWIGRLSDKDGELTGSQIRRGAFNNSGSRDAGKDPNWNFKTGTRINDESYTDLFMKDNPDVTDHGDKFVYDAKRNR